MKKAVLVAIVILIIGMLVWYFVDGFPSVNNRSLFTVQVQKNLEPLKVLFVGDMMFDRGVRGHMRKEGKESILSKVAQIFRNQDLIIGNLEGTITANDSISETDHSVLRFTFDPYIANYLKNHGFSVLSLANNHALDFYYAGYEETQKNLYDANIQSFGSPRNDINLSTSTEIKGKNFCLVGYHDLYVADITPAILELRKIRQSCDLVVVFAHWGNEYEYVQSERQMILAHKFVDAGADLVVGAHPHVVQPVEIYKGKAIFYSLGNFVFDQYFSFGVSHGLAIKAEWLDDRTKFTFVPTQIVKAEVAEADNTDARKILAILANNDSLSLEHKDQILNKRELILVRGNIK